MNIGRDRWLVSSCVDSNLPAEAHSCQAFGISSSISPLEPLNTSILIFLVVHIAEDYKLLHSSLIPRPFHVSQCYTRKESGRPGQFCDVIITYCHDFCRSSLSSPTRPCNRVHIASYSSLRASKDTVVKALVSRELQIKLTMEGVWGRYYIEACC